MGRLRGKKYKEWQVKVPAGKVPLAQAALAQYRLMIEKGLGELDKSGVAELTFQGRDKK